MRVSLNLYTGLNYKINFNGNKKDNAKEDIQKDVFRPREIDENEEAVFRPAVIKYPWIDMSDFRFYQLDKSAKKSEDETPDYVSNIAKLNSYIINTSPHEEFDGYPSNYDALSEDYENFNGPILTMKSPRQLVQYYSDFIHKALRFNPITGGLVTKDILNELEYKIDFEALGIDKSDLSLRDKVKFAALFDFWSVTPNGEPREGYERPDFVKSPKQYVDKLLDIGWVDTALQEAKRFKKRYTYEVRKADDDLQKLLDEEYQQVLKERTERPRAYRGYTPNKYYSPLNLEIAILTSRSSALEAERRAKELAAAPPAYDPNLDMAKAWHEFLGGEWD